MDAGRADAVEPGDVAAAVLAHGRDGRRPARAHRVEQPRARPLPTREGARVALVRPVVDQERRAGGDGRDDVARAQQQPPPAVRTRQRDLLPRPVRAAPRHDVVDDLVGERDVVGELASGVYTRISPNGWPT